MAKKKKDTAVNMDDLFSEIAKETGGDILDEMESIKFFIDSGNLSVNRVCSGRYISGGVPSGRITEVFGPESSGKSLWASNILYGCQRNDGWAVLLDCENASNGEFMAKVSHLNLKRVIRHTPETLEKAFRTMHVMIRKIRDREKELGLERKPIVFVYDSISVSPCERELKENSLPLEFSVTDWKKLVGRKEQPGERAKICSSELRKLQPVLEKEDVTVFIINQTREKIGILYGSPETTGGGGNALKFYASLRLRTQTKKKIEKVVTKGTKVFAGVNLQVKNVKNRTFRPFAVSDDVKLYFDNGVDPTSGLLNCLIEDQRIKMMSAGNYIVQPEYLPEGADEYKFKASKADNRLASQVLLDCPKLIDAESREQVEEYLAAWGSGLAATESGEYEENSVEFDGDGSPLDDEENLDE